MEQHPVPRQITTFEFKLIGFMTLHQFIYLIVFIPLGVVVYYLFPIPIINILLGGVVGGTGFVFAFVPIYDRPLEVWIKNLYKRLTKPTQYLFLKENPPIYYLSDLFFVSDPYRVSSHIESEEKLRAYLARVNKTQLSANQINKKRQVITSLLEQKLTKKPITKPQTQKNKNQPINKPTTNDQLLTTKKTPFFTGIVKNHKLIPLPGILIYVKDVNNKTLRLLKTNPHGVFATFNPLPAAEYLFEFKDPNNNYFFDTMKIKVNPVNKNPIEVYSKELI